MELIILFTTNFSISLANFNVILIINVYGRLIKYLLKIILKENLLDRG